MMSKTNLVGIIANNEKELKKLVKRIYTRAKNQKSAAIHLYFNSKTKAFDSAPMDSIKEQDLTESKDWDFLGAYDIDVKMKYVRQDIEGALNGIE